MSENAPQKQSWAEKPFLERLGIVLGILGSIVAIVGGIYFLWDRYGASVSVDAVEETTVEETTTGVPILQSTTTEPTSDETTTEYASIIVKSLATDVPNDAKNTTAPATMNINTTKRPIMTEETTEKSATIIMRTYDRFAGNSHFVKYSSVKKDAPLTSVTLSQHGKVPIYFCLVSSDVVILDVISESDKEGKRHLDLSKEFDSFTWQYEFDAYAFLTTDEQMLTIITDQGTFYARIRQSS